MSKSRTLSPLKLSRYFQVSPERVFRAWTNPEELRKWWLLGHGWRLNVVEVDLRVGGRYRIGLESTETDHVHEVSGVFKRISAPNELVYTWNVRDQSGRVKESLVTVQFRDHGPSSTELILTHDRVTSPESRQSTYDGWLMVLDGLGRLLAANS